MPCDNKGFTLIEITLVVIMVGILATIGIINYVIVINQGIAQNVEYNFNLIASAENIYYLNNGQYCGSFQSVNPSLCGLGIDNLNQNLKLNLQDNHYPYYWCSVFISNYCYTPSSSPFPAFTVNLTRPLSKVQCTPYDSFHPCPGDMTLCSGGYYSSSCP